MKRELKKKKTGAKSPKTTGEKLSLLAKDKTQKKAVAKNPNVPKGVLFQLALTHPGDVLKNPAFELFHLEDPNFLHEAKADALVALASRPEAPEWVLVSLSTHPSHSVKDALAQGRATSPVLLRLLAKDATANTRIHVAKNPNTPMDALVMLAKDASMAPLAVLSNANVNEELVRLASTSEEHLVLREAAANEKATAAVLERLSRHPRMDVRVAVARNPNTPAKIIEKLSWSDEPQVKAGIVSNPRAPAEIVFRLSQHKKMESARGKITMPTISREQGDEAHRESMRKAVSSVTTIFFDVGGTLLHVDWAKVCDVTGLPARAAALIRANERQGRFQLMQRIERGPVRGYEFIDCCIKAAGLSVTKEKLELLWSKHLEKNLWRVHARGARDSLQALLDQKFRLAVISNSEGKVKQLLEETALAPYFEVIVDSGIEKVEKPDKEIFRRACARMKVQPKSALYVGDIFSIDVVGAQNAGMHAALLDTVELYEIKEAENFLLIRTLSELTRIRG